MEQLSECNVPTFGKFLVPVHPYDFYDITKDNPLPCRQVGTTGIPVIMEDGSCYLTESPILEFNGKLYLISTSFEPSPLCSLITDQEESEVIASLVLRLKTTAPGQEN